MIMVSAQGKKTSGGMSRMMKAGGAWAKRSLQGAVLVAVASTVPAAWGAGNSIQVNNVAAGSATFAQNGKVTTVTTGSQNTIINYHRLTVNSGETLKFAQPNSTSRVLNRIDGSSPTRIDGSLLSNGIVYLVNPAGVMFGQGAVINVGQLYAAASHLSDADFMAGKNHFTEGRGTVTNRGQIQAGEVHLVGKHVANFGSIVTGPLGIVTMTAGKDVYLAPADSPVGAPHVMVKISDDTAKDGGTGVMNAGTIHSGRVQLGSGDVYAAGIYAGGQIKALSVQMDAHGNTALSDGIVDAGSRTGKGGEVEILGAKVAVTGGRVNADGAKGGGSVLIGGDVQGGGGVPASEVAYVGAKAKVSASATEEGAGGKVVVFAKNTARIYGAGGGGGGGGGGRIHRDVGQAAPADHDGAAGGRGRAVADRPEQFDD
jgi:filamentous hemagglutinin family protein